MPVHAQANGEDWGKLFNDLEEGLIYLAIFVSQAPSSISDCPRSICKHPLYDPFDLGVPERAPALSDLAQGQRQRFFIVHTA